MEFWWEKKRDDANWLPTFKKHTHNLKFLELKFLKIKNLLNIILRFKSPLPHVNGVYVHDI
jgi:hypothetical protein